VVVARPPIALRLVRSKLGPADRLWPRLDLAAKVRPQKDDRRGAPLRCASSVNRVLDSWSTTVRRAPALADRQPRRRVIPRSIRYGVNIWYGWII